MKWRNVVILSIGQALSICGSATVVLLGGIIGTDLAPSRSIATLPVSIMVVGLALFATPAALLMGRIGRRPGFLMAAAMAVMAALLAALAVARGSFALLCLATLFIGMNNAFVQQYRFAATESVEPRYAGRAVSSVLVGGILAGFLGPELAQRTMDWLPVATYTGSFVSLALLYVVAAALLWFFQEPPVRQDVVVGSERRLAHIAAQPTFLVAVLAGAVASGVMSFIMTGTPVELHNGHGYGLDQTAMVLQSHIIAMYLPSLFTGLLLERLGLVRVMIAGVACMVGCVALGLSGRELVDYWGALVLLGLGWNLLFVGATVLLTRSYRPAERFKAQATNDTAIFGAQALASLSAGAVLFYANWDLLMVISLAFVATTLAAVLLTRRHLQTPAA